MTQEEMKQEFLELYNIMANSNNVENMHTFGEVMREMMEYLIQTKPDVALDMIQKLESIEWDNYLTQKEADKIIAGMNPKAPWSREVWKQAMSQLDLPTEEEPYYNCHALFVEMNKQYSDHAETIARDILRKPLAEIPAEVIVPAMHSLAIDLLKDRDKVYNIRSYFSL